MMGFGGGSGCGLTTDPDDLNYQVCLKKKCLYTENNKNNQTKSKTIFVLLKTLKNHWWFTDLK